MNITGTPFTCRAYTPSVTMKEDVNLCSDVVILLNEVFKSDIETTDDLFGAGLRFLDEMRSSWIVIKNENEKVIGVAACSEFSDSMHVLNFAVTVKQQGRGLGKYLLRQVQFLACQKGLHKICGTVDSTSDYLCEMYSRMGAEVYKTGIGSRPSTIVNMKFSFNLNTTLKSLQELSLKELHASRRKRKIQNLFNGVGFTFIAAFFIRGLLKQIR